MGIRDERLYYENPELLLFEARVIEQIPSEGHWLVRLNQSAFYPTSGGQPHDTGYLADAKVLDVFIQNDTVYHLVTQPFEVGETVVGKIDAKRRVDHMQQHCGQHILSAAFERELNIDTVGFHLGEEIVTIDLAVDQLDWRDIEVVEQRANQIVLDDRKVTATFVEPPDLGKFALRHPPKVEKDIRIVSIEGFDHNACGGTHPATTGRVGQIKVLATERVRNQVRLSFVCGHRALRQHRQYVEIVRALTQTLSTGSAEIVESVGKLQRTVSDLRKSEDNLKQKIARSQARELALNNARHLDDGTMYCCEVVSEIDDVTSLKVVLKEMADAFVQEKFIIALIATLENRVYVHAAASANAQFAVNDWVKNALSQFDGKGGGTTQAAQGSVLVSPSSDVQTDLELKDFMERYVGQVKTADR